MPTNSYTPPVADEGGETLVPSVPAEVAGVHMGGVEVPFADVPQSPEVAAYEAAQRQEAAALRNDVRNAYTDGQDFRYAAVGGDGRLQTHEGAVRQQLVETDPATVQFEQECRQILSMAGEGVEAYRVHYQQEGLN